MESQMASNLQGIQASKHPGLLAKNPLDLF
jgi:hypothetical protein